MVDLLMKSLVAAPSRLRKNAAGKQRPPKRKKRSLEDVGAMSMISDHVLRDIGLYRAQRGVVSELSDEEIRSWCQAREVANDVGECRSAGPGGWPAAGDSDPLSGPPSKQSNWNNA